VIIACANYSFVALIDISFRTLQPVFLSTPIPLGGLGLDPPVIGTIMAFSGALNGAFTIFFFSRMTDYFGVRWVYLLGMTAAVPCFSLFPILNLLARNSIGRSGELGPEVWVAVGLQVVMVVLNSMCCGASVHFNEVELPLELFHSFGRFRRSLHLHRRRLAQQSLFGGYKWNHSTVCGHRAYGRTSPGELGILIVD